MAKLTPPAGRSFTCSATQYTPFNADGGGWVVFLDRHNIACPADKFLRSWRLQRDSPAGTNIRFAYTCCGI